MVIAREQYAKAAVHVRHEWEYPEAADKAAALDLRIACLLNAAQCERTRPLTRAPSAFPTATGTAST